MGITGYIIEVASRYNLDFMRPQHLRLIWLILPLWLMSALAWRRTVVVRLIVSLCFRTIVLLLIIFALSGLGVKTNEETPPTVIAAVDVSDSMGKEGREWGRMLAGRILESSGEKTHKGVILFAGGSEMKEPPAKKLSLEAFDYTLPTGATDMASAIKTALLAFPPTVPKRLMILSDGNETEGDARAVAEEAAREGVRIDSFSPTEKKVTSAVLKKLDLPEEVNVSEKFTIRILAKNRGEKELRSDLTLRDGENLIKKWSVTLQPGTNAFEIPHRIVTPGSHFISAAIGADAKAKDADIEGGGVTMPILVVDRPKVLCLSGTSEGKNFLAQALEAGDIDVRIGGAELLPESMEGFLEYDCVILSNVPRSSLTDAQMRLIERYVRDYGGGFIMLGGMRSFGPGGYQGTPIERVLPVDMEKSVPFTKDKVVRLSIILVIDKSGSMQDSMGFNFFGTGNKIVAARRAAEELVKQLKANDRVGIIPFDALHHVLVPLGPVGNRKAFIIDRIRTIRADGGTLISRPLEEALRQMQSSPGKVKHVILLTDGRSEDLKRYDYKRLISEYAKRGVTVSTVGIGGDSDSAFLKAIARGSGGEFYHVKDTSTLPIIIIEDTKKVLEKSGFLEETIVPRIGDESEMLKGIQPGQMPRILGYVITKAKERAGVPLYTDIRRLRDPLLAHWRCGLGKTVAFTSDAEARWSREMVSWRMFRKFWVQVLRWAMRERSDSYYLVRVGEGRNRRYLELEIFSPLEDDVSFRAAFPGGREKDKVIVNLHQVAPNTYRSEIATLLPLGGSVVVEKMENGEVTDRKEVPLIRRAAPPASPLETAPLGNNEELLEGLAAVSGGRLNPGTDELVFRPEVAPVTKNLLAWLMPFIFAFLLADVAVRKWGI